MFIAALIFKNKTILLWLIRYINLTMLFRNKHQFFALLLLKH